LVSGSVDGLESGKITKNRMEHTNEKIEFLLKNAALSIYSWEYN
jgi:hypothetical protein